MILCFGPVLPLDFFKLATCPLTQEEMAFPVGKFLGMAACFLAAACIVSSTTATVLAANKPELKQETVAPAGGGQVQASFVFGDSLVDSGNNNYLRRSLATARSMPNGVDFPTLNAAHPTGRFTNGPTIVDLIGMELGIADFAPPVLAPTTKGAALLNGVNYASGGAGILNDTGRIFIEFIPLHTQVSLFEQTVSELKQMLGAEKAQSFLDTSLISVTIGANDFLGNYIFPIPTTLERTNPPPQFIQKLLKELKFQLTRIYEAGARKFVVVNVPVMGCTPYLRSLNVGSHGNCSTSANNLAIAYNKALKSLVQQLNNEFSGATLVYADAYGISAQIVYNYKAYGFGNAEKACCGVALGSEKGVVPCRFPFVGMCENRSDYFFWDPYHPALKANHIIASEFFQGTQFISPINIRQLAAL